MVLQLLWVWPVWSGWFGPGWAAGLAMANAMMTGTFLPFIMRMKAEFRGRFNSVERIYDFTVRILYRTGTWE